MKPASEPSPHLPSTSEFVTIHGLRYHLRHWGRDDAPLLFLVHGWMDVSASYQFLVDALAADWHVVAPDWRGFGLSDWSGNQPGANGYWFPAYLADLDALLDHVSPDAPVNLVGHSMGGNVAMLYAGVRPQRIRRLVNLEGFGLAPTSPAQAPARYAEWLDAQREGARLRPFPDLEAVAQRLMRNNPRLTPARAAFLAPHWAMPADDGSWAVRGDPAHKMTNPVLYRLEEARACWARITAPVLLVEAAQTEAWRWLTPAGEGAAFSMAACLRRFDVVGQLEHVRIEEAGHMVHHDQPEALAARIEAFCR